MVKTYAYGYTRIGKNREYKKQIENFWLLLQQGDETLDYRLAVTAYDGAKMTIEPEGDHGFVGFSRFLNPIVEYLFDIPN